MDLSNFLNFKFEDHPSVKHAARMQELCRPLEKLGITNFCQVRSQDCSSFTTLFNMALESHIKNYISKGHQNIDIHIAPGYCPNLKAIAWDFLDLKGQAYDMVKEAFDCGYKHIFTLVKQRPQHVDYYHFGAHCGGVSINQLYLNHLNLLEAFIEHFQRQVDADPELSEAYSWQIPIKKSPTKDPYEPSKFPPLSMEVQEEFLNQIHARASLSPREKSYLPLILQGLTAKEIAKLLKLSPRTAEDQIQLLRKKLGARNKAELMAKLLRF